MEQWGYTRYHHYGSLSGDGGAKEDTMGLFQWSSGAIQDTIIMGLFQGMVGLKKIPWVSFRGWWDDRRYHGSLSGGGGAIQDTIIMGLFQGMMGLKKIPWVSFSGAVGLYKIPSLWVSFRG